MADERYSFRSERISIKNMHPADSVKRQDSNEMSLPRAFRIKNFS